MSYFTVSLLVDLSFKFAAMSYSTVSWLTSSSSWPALSYSTVGWLTSSWWPCRQPQSNGETPVVTHMSASTELLPSPQKLSAIPSIYTSSVELGKVVKNLGMASQAKVGRGFVVALSLATIKRKDQGWPTEWGSSQGWPAEREP